MKHNAKRVLSIALALFMCVSMLTCIVLPVSVAETVPSVWGTYGLAPTTKEDITNGYVDLTAQDIAMARPNITETTETRKWFMAAAPDWSKYAYKDYDATTGTLSNQYTSVSNKTTETPDTDAVLDINEKFYAKMPTTGIVYKLTYGVTAADSAWCNPYACATVLLFPGEHKYFYYESTPPTGYSNSTSVYGSKADNNQMVLGYNNAKVRVIGPQAGISAVDGGRTYTDTATEAYLTNYIYVRNELFNDGGSLTIDGVSSSSYISTTAGNGAKWNDNGKKNNVFTLDLKNCEFNGHATPFILEPYNDPNKTADKKDKLALAVASGVLNVVNCSITAQGEQYTALDGIHIKDSEITITGKDADFFYINPSQGDMQTTKIGVEYTAENSTIKLNGGNLFTMSNTITDTFNSTTRNALTFEVKNNTVTGAGGLVKINAGAADSVNADMAAITDITVTGNTVSGSGDLVASYGAEYALRSADISGNVFDGFATNTAPAFTGFANSVDFTDNLYKNGDAVISANVASGKVTDVALNKDLTVYASDFAITEGAATDGIKWTAGTDILADIAANTVAEVTYAEGITTEDIINSLKFASDKVSVVSLTTDDTEIDDETVFELTLAHSDCDFNLKYNLTFACIHKQVTPDTAEGSYLAPTCGTAGYQKGTCNRCSENITQIIAPTEAHAWDAGLETAKATCTKAGEIKYVCTNDDCMKDGQAVKYVVVGKLPHSASKEVIPYEGKQATCYAAGEGYIECTVCGQKLEEHIAIEQLDNHVIAQSVTVEKAPTCVANGAGHYECIYCHISIIGDVTIPANGVHTGGEWVVTQQPTLLKEGIETSYCIYCDEVVETRAIDVLVAKEVTKTFTDISDKDWYVVNGSVYYVYNAGLFKGTTATAFSPKASMTRGMFVTVLGRLHGVTSTNGTTKYADVNSNKYYAPFVKWASENGIVNGVTATSFAPDSNITREQICVMLLRYCNYAKITLKDISSAYAFTDQDSISAYAKDAVAACQIAGIVSGEATNDGYRFRPQGTATRAEVATILKNFAYNHL